MSQDEPVACRVGAEWGSRSGSSRQVDVRDPRAGGSAEVGLG